VTLHDVRDTGSNPLRNAR